MLHGRVGHYEVSARLGGGGGGEVYRARDTLLDRPVAIKVLNPDALGDPRCLARFRREAQLAASLDHPYLCHVHELVEHAGTLLIVMEFVEGETLAERLSRGQLPLAEALQLGAELAEGLAAAHAHGLVHRDVKPSNVMVTPHQHVKLMDFGLARPVAAECSTRMPGDESTVPGEVVGTPRYMAPEQAVGESVDARTDVFAFGLVLYECLAGRSPFDGHDRVAHREQLLAGRRRPLAEAVPALPGDVVGVVETCLAHDRTRRFASAQALAGEMRELLDRHGSHRQPAPVNASPRGPRPARVLALAAVAAGVVGGAAWLWPRSPHALPEPSSFEPLVTWATTERDAGVSPDGLWTSFVSNAGGTWRLWLRRAGGGDPRQLDAPPGAIVAHGWSPDGAEIALVTIKDDAAWLHVVAAPFGDPPRATLRLPRAAAFVHVAGWAGSTVFLELSSPTSLWRADLRSGAVSEIAAFRSGQGAGADRRRQRDFAVDRAGGHVLFTADALGHEDIWIARIDGSDRRVLTGDAFGERSAVWLGETGRFVYQSNRGGQIDVWAQDLGGGHAGRVTASSAIETPEASSRAGDLLVMRVHEERSNLWRIAASGEEEPLTGDALSDAWPSVSADGARVVFQRAKSRSDSLYAFENTTVMSARLGEDGLSEPRAVGEGYAARVSPDGRFVAALRPSAASRYLTELWVTDLETSLARRLTDRVANAGYEEFPFDRGGDTAAWRADGSALIFLTSDEPASLCRWRPARWADEPERLARVAPPPFGPRQLALGPDGDAIAVLASPEADANGAIAIVHERGGAIERWPVPPGPGDVHLLGWRVVAGSVLAARVDRGGDGVRRMQVLEVTARGAVERARWSDVHPASVRPGPGGETLLASRREGLEHGLSEYSLRTERWRRLTRRALPGVAFGGVECAGRAALVCARQEVKDDIWAMRLSVGGS